MDRVIEIVNYVMKQVLYQKEKICSEKELVEALVQLGYQPEEIVLAFRLLYSIPNSLKADMEVIGELVAPKGGNRVFSQKERKKLSYSCQGEIIRLMNDSLLTINELETVIFQALQLETEEVGLRELELILHKVIPDQERLMMILPHPPGAGNWFLIN